MWAAGGRGILESSCRSDPGISNPNHTQEDGKGVELQATQKLHQLGDVIYFFLTSSVSADFSNQAIICLQGKRHEMLGDCSGTS